MVVLEGEGPLTLTEDLTVTKQLLADTGLVMASGNLTVSGTGAFLRGGLDLGVGTLTVEQGAIVWSDSYANFGSVHVSGGLLVNSGELTLTGESALTLAEQGSLVKSWLPPFPGGECGLFRMPPFSLGDGWIWLPAPWR